MIACRSAKCVCSADQNIIAIGLDPIGEFSDRCSLTHPIYSDDHHHVRPDIGAHFSLGKDPFFARIFQDLQQLIFDEPLQLFEIAHLISGHFLARIIYYLYCSLDTYIGSDERFFEAVEHISIDHLLAKHDILDAGHQIFACAIERSFPSLKDRLLFYLFLLEPAASSFDSRLL